MNLLPGKDGLLHISQIAHERVEKVTDYLKEGQIVKVKVLETDEKGRVKLSMKALLEREPPGRSPAAINGQPSSRRLSREPSRRFKRDDHARHRDRRIRRSRGVA